MKNMKKIFPDLNYCKNPYEVADGSNLLIFLTEWDIFRKLNFQKIKSYMKTPYIIDGRNFLDYEKILKLGFVYTGIGRKINESSH